MRVLIFSAAILAVASGRPSGLVAPIGAIFTGPTLGDAQALAIDTKVQAEDNLRQAVDLQRDWTEQVVEDQNENVRTLTDQAREINEQNFWNAEEQKWQTYDAIKTAESQLDGAVAGEQPLLAKAVLAPAQVAVAAPAVYAAQPAVYAAQPAVYAAQPIIAAAPLQTYSTVVKPETKTIVTQSLSQTHPAPAAPAVFAEPIIKAAPIVEAPIIEPAPIVEAAPAIIEPAKKTIVTQSLSQTHPSPIIAQPVFKVAEPVVKYAAPVELVQPAYTQTVIQPETKSVVSSSLSQTHGTPYVAANYIQPAQLVHAPLSYSAPIYKSELVASTW